jgi:hypothetical protein
VALAGRVKKINNPSMSNKAPVANPILELQAYFDDFSSI